MRFFSAWIPGDQKKYHPVRAIPLKIGGGTETYYPTMFAPFRDALLKYCLPPHNILPITFHDPHKKHQYTSPPLWNCLSYVLKNLILTQALSTTTFDHLQLYYNKHFFCNIKFLPVKIKSKFWRPRETAILIDPLRFWKLPR